MISRRQMLSGSVATAVALAMRRARAHIGPRGSQSPGALRPLGLQPGGPPAYYDTEMVFLDLVKSAGFTNTYLNCPWQTSNGSVNDTGEEAYVQLDSNGYPTSLVSANVGNGNPPAQQFTYLGMLLHYAPGWQLWNGQTYYYPPGTYRLKYIGQGTVGVTGDATYSLTNSSPNTYTSGTFTVSSPTGTTGLKLVITAINSNTDYPRDISVVQETYVSAYDAGQIFHPNFLALYRNMKCVRGMQWNKQDNLYIGYYTSSFSVAQGATSCTLGNAWQGPTGTYTMWFYGGQSVQASLTYGATTCTWTGGLASAVSVTSGTEAYIIIYPPQGWANRTPTTYVSYAMAPAGVPEEIILAHANALNADCWLNARLDADDTYIGNLATLANSTLGSGQKVYVELSNEVWHGSYPQSNLAQMFGCAQWTTQANNSTQQGNWHGMRTAVMSEILASTLGGAFTGRCIPVIGAQTGNTAVLTSRMNTTYWTSPIDGYSGPASAHKILAVCTAYYWGPGGPGSGTGQISTTDATTLVGVSDPASEFFALMNSNVGTVANGSHTYSSLSFTGYGSQTFLGFQGSAQSARLYDKANAATYSLELLGYEVGDFFTDDNSVVSGWGTLVVECEQDTRMETAYQYALDWEAANVGSSILVIFSDAQQPATTGSFGLAMSCMQTLNASNTPKWQAAQNYIAGE
jgi:hypothetical protein